MVEKKFEEISTKVISILPQVSLLAFLKMDDDQETWSILYSDPQITDAQEGKEERRKIFRELAKIISSVLMENSQLINRIGVFSEADHLVADALRYKAGTIISEDTKMNGNVIHEGYILISK